MALGSYRGYVVTALLGLWIYGCGGGASKVSTTPESGGPGAAPPVRTTKVVTLSEQMMADVKVEALNEKSLPLLLTTTGKVEFNEDRMARILAPVSGQVQQLRVKIGDTVRAGETLFFIHSREVATALAEHFESRKDLDLAEKTYAMTKDLFEHKAAARIALQQA